jgi:protein-disulfide isomerase
MAPDQLQAASKSGPAVTQESLSRGEIVAAATVIAVAACAVFVWLSRDINPPRPPEPPPPSDPVSLDGAVVRGVRTAPVALLEFSEFQCPFCGDFARDTEPKILSTYVDTGRVLFAFRHFPLENIHPNALGASRAAECANRVGSFWPAHDLLFQNQNALDDEGLESMGKRLGLDVTAFNKCRESEGAARVAQDEAIGNALGIRSTPTLFLGKVLADGRVKVLKRLVGAQPFRSLSAALDQLLK